MTPDRLLVEGELEDLVDGRVVAPARRDVGEHAAPRRGWRPARPAPPPPRRAPTSPRIGSVHGCSSRKPVCRSPATNSGWRSTFEQLVAVGDRPVERAPSRASASSRRIASSRVAAVGDDLGDHRVVVRRDGRAGLDAGVDAHAPRLAVLEPVERADRRAVAGGRVLGGQADLDGVAGLVGLEVVRRRAARRRRSRSCAATRSSPVTASVTGCSTCRRVFISRNQKLAVGVEQELDGAGADVVDGARPRRSRPPTSAGAGRRRRPATGTPRRSSGGGAGSSTPARAAATTLPWVSPNTWISMCRPRST